MSRRASWKTGRRDRWSREAVLTDLELTERQKQMLIEIYESFRKETTMARAEAGELIDDQTGLSTDEAALAWPENLSPAALVGRARLAIARYTEPDDADLAETGLGDGGDEAAAEAELGDEAWLDDDDSGPAGLGDGPWQAPGTKRPGPGGTLHQFPPPAGTR